MTDINRLVMHHSGGRHEPNALDLEHYHRIVAGSGEVLAGRFPVAANAAGRKLAPGTYAAHTWNLNSGSIGLSMACMLGGQWDDPRACAAFPTRPQVDAFITEAARLCNAYGIRIGRRTVLTHAEVQTTLGVKQRNKWDFDYDPFGVLDSRDPIVIGDMLRDRIADAVLDVSVAVPVIETPGPAPARSVLRRGSTGAAVGDLQRLLGIKQDRIFGPATDAALRAHQKARHLLADGIAGPMTWASLERK